MKRLMHALILLGMAGLFPSVSWADDFGDSDYFDVEKKQGEIHLGYGRLLNNTRIADGRFIDLTAWKNDVFYDLQLQAGYTHVIASNFGNHHGSEQITTLGLMKPWRIGRWSGRVGGGLNVNIHLAWAGYTGKDGMQQDTFYTAECNWCGWFGEVSVDAPYIDIAGLRWIDRCELNYRYMSTDPAMWTSHNGGLAKVSCDILHWRGDGKGDALFGKTKKPALPQAPRKEPAVVQQEEARMNAPSATCSPPAQLEADNNAVPRRMTGPI